MENNWKDRALTAENALRAIRNACPPGVCTLEEFEKFARGIAGATIKTVDAKSD